MNWTKFLFFLFLFFLFSFESKVLKTSAFPEFTAINNFAPSPTGTSSTYNIKLNSADRPKNLILMIADGMGITQLTAGLYANGNKLNIEGFPVTGMHKSYSVDSLISDSGAGATAFACGIKTYNGAIGVDPDSLPVRSIFEEAETRGLATGLVSASSIVGATPASFIAHQKQKNLYEQIATDYLNIEIDFLVGGGKKFFNSRESDSRDLYQEFRDKGYLVSDFKEAKLLDVKISAVKNFVYFTAELDPLPVLQGRDYLQAASRIAPRFLKEHNSEQGFFLMIESTQIEKGGQANDPEYIISEVLDFDRAIGEILTFAEADGETLVIVTSSHETGGLSINFGSKVDSLITSFTTNYNTAILTPVFAYGPGAEIFSGIYENTDINKKMRKALGFDKASE